MMPNQALVNYIVQQLNNGFKQEAISQHLINNGYKQQDVLEALNAASIVITLQRSAAGVSSASGVSNATYQNQAMLAKAVQEQVFQQPQIQQANILQANPQLVSYITQQRNMGFSQEQIRSYLLKYGYQQQQVEPALDSVFHPNAMNAAVSQSPHITHLGAIVVSVIVLVSVFSGAGLFFFFNNAAQAPELLDYRLDAAKKIFNPGETLIFEARMDKASGDEFDVKLTHTIYDNEDNEIESVDETAAAEPRIASKMELPDSLKPGRYKLVSVGTYGEDDAQEVSASFNFEVKAAEGTDSVKGDDKEKLPKVDQPKKVDAPKKTDTKPQTTPYPATQQPKTDTPDKTLPVSTTFPATLTSPESQPSTQPSADNPTLVKDAQKDTQPKPDEDDQKVSIDDIEADVRIKAADPIKISEADALCQTLTTQNEKDYCYSDIAEVSKQKQYCDKINHQYRRDVCYLNNFMEKGDYSVCDVIIDFELNLACKEQAKRAVTSSQTTTSSSPAQSSTAQATPDSSAAQSQTQTNPASTQPTTTAPSSSAVPQPNPDNTTSTTNTNDAAANQTTESS